MKLQRDNKSHNKKNWIFRNLLFKKLLITFLIFTGIATSIVITELLLRTINELHYGHNYFLWPPYLSKEVTTIPDVLPGVEGTKRFYINSLGMRGDELNADHQFKMLE